MALIEGENSWARSFLITCINQARSYTGLESARTFLEASNLPARLWAEAVRHSCWLANRTPKSALPDGKSPYEMATGIKPDLSEVKPWGVKVYVRRINAGKLSSQADEGRFVGFDDESKGSRIYWPLELSPSKGSWMMPMILFLPRKQVIKTSKIHLQTQFNPKIILPSLLIPQRP